MRNDTFSQTRRCPHCGALCHPTKARCLKCYYRVRWYRRKAWRINPTRHPTQNSSERSDTA
jgi:hypothetical protein